MPDRPSNPGTGSHTESQRLRPATGQNRKEWDGHPQRQRGRGTDTVVKTKANTGVKKEREDRYLKAHLVPTFLPMWGRCRPALPCRGHWCHVAVRAWKVATENGDV